MMGEGIPKKPGSPAAPEPPPHAVIPSQPRSGSGADTALEALIRKRLFHAASETSLPGDGTKTPLPKD